MALPWAFMVLPQLCHVLLRNDHGIAKCFDDTTMTFQGTAVSLP